MAAVGEALAEQMKRSWKMLRTAIEGFEADEWQAGERSELVPARWALHAIEAGDFYAKPSPEGFTWGRRFQADWEGSPPKELPTQEQTLVYMKDVARELDDWLTSASGEELLGENAFPWTGANPMSRMIYLMRHTQHHAGEMNMLLRQRGWSTDNWA
jgi:hypothetical protein